MSERILMAETGALLFSFHPCHRNAETRSALQCARPVSTSHFHPPCGVNIRRRLTVMGIPTMVFADGRRSPAPEDFRGSPIEVLAYIAERTNNPVLRARLSDLCWLLDWKRGQLGTLAISSYVEIVQKIDSGDLKLRRFEKKPGALHHADGVIPSP